MAKQKIINNEILTTIGIFFFIIILIIKYANKLMGTHTSINKYMIQNDYTSTGDLLNALKQIPERLFVWCCDCIRFYAIQMGISYEQLNIDLFVILQPMLILLFFILFLIQSDRLRKINQ